MSFQFSESHIVEHRMLGYTVFRQIILPSLLRYLRQACSKGHELARKSNPRAMRMAVNRDGQYGKASLSRRTILLQSPPALRMLRCGFMRSRAAGSRRSRLAASGPSPRAQAGSTAGR